MKRTTRQVSHRGAYSDDLCSGFVSEESSTNSMNPAFVIIVKVSNLRVISFCERSEQHESVCGSSGAGDIDRLGVWQLTWKWIIGR